MMKLFLIATMGLLLTGMIGATRSAPPFYADRLDLLTVIDDKGRLQPVRNGADWQQRREHILANMQLVMGPVPVQWRSLPLEMNVLEETSLPQCIRKKITYRVEPQDCATAYLFLPRNGREKTPAVLCLHQTIDVGKDEPAGLGGSPDLHYAVELAQRGYVTLAPDYWTFGDYRQKKYDPYPCGYVSGTMKGIWTHIRSLDLLQSLPQVDGDRIGCIGHSLGGHNTLWLGAFDARVKVMVSSCGFNTMAGYAASKYGGGDLHNYAQQRYLPRVATTYGNDPRKVPFEWTEVLACLSPRPVFVNAPWKDVNFEIDSVIDALRAARTVYEWMGAGDQLISVHPDCEHSFPPEVRRMAYEFIDRALGVSQAPGPGAQ